MSGHSVTGSAAASASSYSRIVLPVASSADRSASAASGPATSTWVTVSKVGSSAANGASRLASTTTTLSSAWLAT